MTDTSLTLEQLAAPAGQRRRESIVRGLVFAAAIASVLISALIVWSLLREAWVFMTEIDWSLTWGQIGWFPRRGIYDMPTLLVATLIVTVIAMIVAAPLGLGAAIYMSEYARPGVRKVLKPTLEILAGIPSVVLGAFAIAFIAPNVVANIGGSDGGSLMAAGIGVGILTIPLVASISEDAMRSVPRELREASEGLGARKITTVTRVVLPAAVSGLVAAFIVAVSRAIGETMVVFLAGGAADAAVFNADPYEGSLTMTAAMASLASGTDQVVGAGLTFQSLFFVGLVLFLITLVLNMIGNAFVARVREKY
ncbi:phosphate ABC transporter permease subunit PstC [Ilumatobacter sp.]|uniref:phosphate ABC transporter permease subunit PstC n=1 Tax=Ilumatobacter sp. TaxID=1967498 RepID=UPI003C42DA42